METPISQERLDRFEQDGAHWRAGARLFPWRPMRMRYDATGAIFQTARRICP